MHEFLCGWSINTILIFPILCSPMAADLHMLLMWVFIPRSSWTITPRSRALETDRIGISETVIDSDDGNLSRGLTCTTSVFPRFKFRLFLGWVESNFTNPTVKVWVDLDNPFKRSDYAKLCVSPSLDGTLPESVISQEDNPPLTLYIDFHNSFIYFLDINRRFNQVHS